MELNPLSIAAMEKGAGSEGTNSDKSHTIGNHIAKAQDAHRRICLDPVLPIAI